ncbi:MAG TPA: hypothetical protein VK646_10070 [Actinomycetota bacterium]|nr:hypothetical protein [Actinomycetota bacterium]
MVNRRISSVVAVGILVVALTASWLARQDRVVMSVPAVATGTLSGHLVAVGGPSGTSFPLAGALSVMSVREAGSPTFGLSVESDGAFSVVVPAGTYQVEGMSPSFEDGKALCAPEPDPVEVDPGANVVVDVICTMR